MPNLVMTPIYITPAQKRALARHAKQRRTTVSEEVRSALEKHLHDANKLRHLVLQRSAGEATKTVQRMVRKLDRTELLLGDMQKALAGKRVRV